MLTAAPDTYDPLVVEPLPPLRFTVRAYVFSTVMDSDLVALPLGFVALTVKVLIPAVVGIPLMMPVDEFRLRLAGSAPPEILQVKGNAVLAASKVWLYAIPTVPSGKLPVVIIGTGPDGIAFAV
jgi:hypothetical protein